MEKKCYKCNELKTTEDFHKDCIKKDGLSNKCKSCVSIYNKEYRLKNKEYFKKYGEKYREQVVRNDDYFKNYNKIYYQEKLKQKRKIRKENDSLYKLKLTFQSRTSFAFKRKKWIKNNKYEELLGGNYNEVYNYLELKFKENMSWINHGEWHIDHIIPLSSAKTKEELIKLCHYTNLQPLWANENWKKGYKII